jgi:predicted Zn-dependent peptidase
MKENFQKSILPNGIRVLTERIPHYPSATIGIWVDVGSASEDESHHGASHFLEHLMFKGTPTRSAKEIAEIMDGLGGNLNAFTEKEQTCFYAKVMDKHVPIVMELLGDMLLNSHFPQEEMEREKGVILEEIRMYEDSPDELIFDLLAQTVWKDHPLGRPILGTAESISSMTREALREFVRHFYTPDKITIFAVGKIKHEQMVELVERYFPYPKFFENHKPVLPPLNFVPGKLVKFKEIEQVHFCLGLNGISQKDERKYAFSILDVVLGGSVSSRLFQEVREKRGLVYTLSTYQGFFANGGLFGVYGATSRTNLDAVLKLVQEILLEVRENGITKKELQTAKEHLKGSLSLALESSSNRMIRLAKNEFYHKRFVTHQEVLKKIESVTLEEIKKLAEEILNLEGSAWVALGPIKEELRVG